VTVEAPLVVDGLTVELDTPAGPIRVVEDVSVELAAGQTLGLVGESGSGKTVSALAVLGLIRPPVGRVVAGSVRLAGQELVGLADRDLRRIRGARIGMVFQEPRRNLDPAFTVGDQIAETVRAHRKTGRRESWRRAVEMLDLVGIADAGRRARDFPHQFSGGMAQRVMLAAALCCSPDVLIADEPTTALDVTVQARVLDLIRDLQAELGLSVLFVSHDLGVIAQMCDRVAVMYAGRVVERAGVEDLFVRPQHPYTAALLAAVPHPDAVGFTMEPIPGSVPSVRAWPSGCRFHPRCAHALDRCRTDVPELRPGDGARCLRAGELDLVGIR
jgi:peptide/nickel transport system ATP-binding protein